jgi:hypothetical protein
MVFNLHSLTFFDISAIILMFVLAYLSKRLGDALKIKPFYKMLHVTAFCIACASIFDIVSSSFNFTLPFVSMSLRFISSAGAFLVCLRYWNWLFSEFLRNQ